VSSEAFSLGVVLFELATGTKPYSGNRLAALQDYAGEESQFWAHADMLQAGEELRNGKATSLFS
jgi:DNA-binding helix-hairpin-helix protein with protein kinase domain